MAEKFEKLKPEEIAILCEKIFALPVEKVTAPGGKSRESLRVHFPGKNIIVTQRRYPGRMRLEIEVLKRLSDLGAPVPKYLGGVDQIFFQEDIGSQRLTTELNNGNPARRLELAHRSFESLIEIHAAGAQSGLAEIVPALGAEEKWVRGFIGSALVTADNFKVDRPVLDLEGLVGKLHVPATKFVKWDARPGNGSIHPDGRVFWFDWEHCGRRQGMEDFAWLAGDEFWPLTAKQVLTTLESLMQAENRAAELTYLGHFITFHMMQRLNMIYIRFQKEGWVDPVRAMRYDHIGTDGQLAKNLCLRAKDWADLNPLTRPMAAFFQNCHDAVDGLQRDEKP